MAASRNSLITFASCGELLRFLRRRARLSLRELSIEIGYSESHLSRIEHNERPVDRAILLARFVPALHIENEPEIIEQLLNLCNRQERSPASPANFSIPPLPAVSSSSASDSSVDTPNLLPQLTSFIGRAEEVAEVCSLLREQNVRLVTLTGAGGCGKTRLALRICEEMASFSIDGVHLVDLASLTDPHLLPTVLATAVGLSKVAGDAALAAMIEVLRPSRRLLLLDNCEHLVEAVAALTTTLLRSCPQVQILTTSREALAIPGEFIYRVQPLALPSIEMMAQPSAAMIAQYDSIRLFVERARATLHTFTLTDRNALAVARICRRLDGIPLCIELAAGWIAILTPEQIAAQLEHDLSLLTSASRRTLPRHQTLRATVDWSYRLLSEQERELIRRLAIFRGGWDLNAAGAIAANVKGAVTAQQVVMLLRQLANKSLIVVDDPAGHGARYRLLEPIREALHEKIIEAGEETELQQRHLAYYARLTDGADIGLAGAGQQRWLDQLEIEHDNLRLALKRGSEHSAESAAIAAQMASRIWRFWLVRGHYAEGRLWLEQALARGLPSDPVRVRLLYGAGVLARLQLDLEAAQRFAEEQLHLAQRLGDSRGIADSHGVMGWIAEFTGAYQEAFSHFNERLSISRSLEDQRGVAYALRGLGETATALGRHPEARAWLNEALMIFLRLRDRRYTAQMWNDLGILAHNENEPEIARSYFQRSLAAYHEVNDRHGVALLLLNLSRLALTQHDTPGAVAYHEEAVQQIRRLADKLLTASMWSNQARLEYAAGDLTAAETAIAQAIRLRYELNHRPGIVEDLEQCAALALATHHAIRAVCLWGAAERARSIMHMPAPIRDQALRAQQIDHVRSHLSLAAFESAWQTGWSMSWEQAIGYAIGA